MRSSPICSIDGCERSVWGREMCSLHYQRWWKHGDPMVTLRHVSPRAPKGATIEERFWIKVDKDGPTPEHRPDLGPCWMWTASITSQGYGQFRTDLTITAHRYSFWLERGYLPPPEEAVDHLCDNPLCVRASHLEHTTRSSNTLRGKSPTAMNARKTHCPHGHEYTPENTRRRGKDGRRCRTCQRERQRTKYHQLQEERRAERP